MTHPKTLITGVTGFIGRHLAAYLLSLGESVIGVGRSAACMLQSTAADGQFCYQQTDYSLEQLTTILRKFKPDHVVHLVGDKDVSTSWRDPIRCVQTNVILTQRLLEAIRLLEPGIVQRIVCIGSLHEYDMHAGDANGLSEHTSLCPSSPYGFSKSLQTGIVELYGRLYSLPILLARTFNLIGPDATAGVCAQLAKRTREIRAGGCPAEYTIGDPQIARDFLDVFDAVRAYHALLHVNDYMPGEVFNVCSGTATSIATLIQCFAAHTGHRCAIRIDPNFIRSDEPIVLVGNPTKLTSRTGWVPSVSLEVSIDNMIAR